MAALSKRPGVTGVLADRNDPAKFKFAVHGEPATGDVTNLFGYVKAYPDNFDVAVDKFLKSAVEISARGIDDRNIVAAIRTRDYVSGQASVFLHEALGADLVVVYMADRPDSMSPLTLNDVPGKDLAAVRRLASDHLRRWLPKLVSDHRLGVGSLYYVADNPMLSTSLILSDDFWKSIAPRFPNDVLIAIPRKDQLFIFNDDGKPATRAAALRLIGATIEENFALLSPHLYARRNGKIVVAD